MRQKNARAWHTPRQPLLLELKPGVERTQGSNPDLERLERVQVATRPEVELALQRCELGDVALANLEERGPRVKARLIQTTDRCGRSKTHRFGRRSTLNDEAITLLLLTEQETEQTPSCERA